MNEIFYLEADEEITSVIDRLKKAEGKSVAFVIPRGGSLAQSIVNLKLLKKSASKLGIDFSLVTTDRISRNLASQVGLSVFSKVSEAEKSKPKENKLADIPISEEGKGEFRVNSYYTRKDEDEAEFEPEMDIEEEESEQEIEEGPKEETQGELDDYKEDSILEVEEKVKTPEPKESKREKISLEEKHKEESEKKLMPEKKTQFTEGAFRGGQQKPKNLSRTRKILLGVIGGCLILCLAVSYIFVPYANATVILKTEELKLVKEIIVDGNAKTTSSDTFTIPGRTVEVEKNGSQTYNATGSKDVGTKATGKITLYNEWQTSPQILSKGTKLISNGKAFVLTSDISIPAETIDPGPPSRFVAGTIEANFEAENAGDSYNIGPSNFTIPTLPQIQQSRIYGKSTSAMSGGTTKTIKIITDQDLKNASSELSKSITEGSKEEITTAAEAAKVQIFSDNASAEILDESTPKKVGDEADTFEYTVKMRVTALGFDQEEAKKLLLNEALKQAGENKMLVNEDKADITYSFVAKDDSSMKMTASFSGRTGQRMDMNSLKEGMVNKKFSEAKSYLESQSGTQSAEVSIWPSPIFKVPLLKNRIKIKFDYQQ